MFLKKVLTVIISILFYQTHLYSKSNSFNNFNQKNLSNYFSGIVAFENKKNSDALNFYNSSKILINQHDPYLKRYVTSLVLENKVSQAINIIKLNKENENTKFFDAYLLLIIDSLKRGNFDDAYDQISRVTDFFSEEKLKSAILNILKEYLTYLEELDGPKIRLNQVLKHIYGLNKGLKNARKYRYEINQIMKEGNLSGSFERLSSYLA